MCRSLSLLPSLQLPVLTTCGGGRSPPGPGQRPVHCRRSSGGEGAAGKGMREEGRRAPTARLPLSPSPPSSSSSSPPNPARPGPPGPLPAGFAQSVPGPGSPALLRHLLCHPVTVSLSPRIKGIKAIPPPASLAARNNFVSFLPAAWESSSFSFFFQ